MAARHVMTSRHDEGEKEKAKERKATKMPGWSSSWSSWKGGERWEGTRDLKAGRVASAVVPK